MSVSKTIPLGKIGSLTFAENSGVESIAVSLDGSLGGGEVAGFLTGKASIEADVQGIHLADIGLMILSSKYPQFAAEIALVKSSLDAEIAKI